MKDAFLLPIIIISLTSTSSYACDSQNCLDHNLFSAETMTIGKSYLEQYGACDAGHFQKQIIGRHNLVHTKSFMFSEKLPAIYSDFIHTCKSSKCKYKSDGSISRECIRAYDILFNDNEKNITSIIPKSMTVDHITKNNKTKCSSEN